MFVDVAKYINTLEEEKKSKFLKWACINNIVTWDKDNKEWYKIIPNMKNIEGAVEPIIADHRNIFQKKDGTKVWIIQPYYNKEQALSIDLIEWSSKRGLDVKFDEENSWHFVGTILIQFEIKDINITKNYIMNNRVLRHPRSYFIE